MSLARGGVQGKARDWRSLLADNAGRRIERPSCKGCYTEPVEVEAGPKLSKTVCVFLSQMPARAGSAYPVMIKSNVFLQTVFEGAARVAQIGADPADSEQVQIEKAIQLNAVVLGGIPMHVVWLALAILYDEDLAAAIAFGFGILSVGGVVLLARMRVRYTRFKFTQLGIAILSPFCLTLVLGGIANAAFVQMWGLIAALLALIHYGIRQAHYWLIVFLVSIFVSGLAQPLLRQDNNFPQGLITALTVINIMGISVMVFAAFAYFVRQRDLAFRLLSTERSKVENLLYNILPREIAAILKEDRAVIADQYASASVLFADIVNFTPLSAQMSPVELVELLNTVFSQFDALVEHYGLEKIKTIGDCYMVAAGVPRPRSDHAHILACLALDIRDRISGQEFNGRRLTFRIGLNSGPVVAGVIGRKKFIYDLWGDAVNTASRMESHGAGGFIQITEATYDLIKNDFVCESHGAIQVKGKGEMKVWYVLAKIS